MKTINTAIRSSSVSLQSEFDVILANQEWYALSLQEKLNLLCNAGSEYKVTLQESIKAVVTHRKIQKQRSVAKVKTRNRKEVKVARATTVIFEQGVKTSTAIIAAGRQLLRSIGRKTCGTLSTIESEILSLNLDGLRWKMREEAVQSAWNAFKAVLAQSA